MIYVDDHIDALNLEEALKQVSLQRREKALRYRQETGKRQSVAAYLLLKEGLLCEYGITDDLKFGFHEKGKPFLIGHTEIHFSLSHCRQAVACAISDCPIGIDIEQIRPFNLELAAHVLNESDLQQVTQSEHPDVEFCKLWTQKESFLKLTGEGICNHLKELDMSAVRQETVMNLNRGYVWTVSSFN